MGTVSWSAMRRVIEEDCASLGAIGQTSHEAMSESSDTNNAQGQRSMAQRRDRVVISTEQ
jgi:hypothetical protein